MKAGSALVPVMAVYWLEGGQVSACNQPVCDLHLELYSGEKFPMTAAALSWLSQAPDCKFDNTRPHTVVVTQHALHSVYMLPWPARSPDLSPIDHVWDIIGRQLQRHSQPA
ncbi:hypothetical protein AVEN_131412-1 [Araneus ventricosus]|uniref:Tc1-like transposase DDE domain-containing protein n=1 Tax=Araneus ventricosus TaxID=182803 RepID=A0A4Y2QA55_ARAVE|nr:hypothetical protein AVEN_131412-1 [Araneus ventricosus]